jgi:uncharacterized phage protein gp47/JayE
MPITDTGYQRRTLDVVLESIQNLLRGKISLKLDLSERAVFGNSSNIDAAAIDELEQLIEEAYNAFDPDNASDDRFVAISALTGVRRRVTPTKGLVTQTLNLDAGQSYAPGDIAFHVIDEPTNRWLNRDAVTSATAGNYSAVFESETAGASTVAEAGTLTVIATPVAGLNSGTNASAATPGKDIESIPALRIRREQSVAAGGSRTRGAIRAKLVAIDGVLDAEVFENVTNTIDADGIAPHNIRPVIWDGSPAAADDDALAQVIWDHRAEGILSQGTESGTARDPTFGLVIVAFDRADAQNLTIAVSIESETTVSAADVKAAIIAKMSSRVGQGVNYNRLSSSVFDVTGVDDWATFTINGGTADLAAVQNRVYLLDEADITVTGDVT